MPQAQRLSPDTATLHVCNLCATTICAHLGPAAQRSGVQRSILFGGPHGGCAWPPRCQAGNIISS